MPNHCFGLMMELSLVMSYYDDLENVLNYRAMSEGFDGRRLIVKLERYLMSGASLLELGMGEGKDYEILSARYRVTGSDNSRVFLNLFREKDPSAELLNIDAAILDIDISYRAIYSNKVLQHLSRDEIRQSFSRQSVVLEPGGIAMHSFWAGTGEERHNGLLFGYYSEKEIREIVEPHFEILEMNRYNEMKAGDSIYCILRVKG